MTRLGDLLRFGKLFKAGGNHYFAQIVHILGNFCKGVKIFHFTREILFVQLLWTFGNFLLVTLFIINTVCYHQLISMYSVVSTQQLYLHYPKSVDFN